MALVLDSVLRPKQAHLHDLSRSEGADTGRGEAFADALLRAGSPDTEGSDPAQALQIAASAAPQAAAPPQYDTSGNPRAAAAASATPLVPSGKDNTAPREPALPLTGGDPATAPQLAAPAAPQAAAPPQYDTSGNPRAAAAASAAPLPPSGKDNTAPREPALPLTGSDPATTPQLAAPAAPQAGGATGAGLLSANAKGDTGQVQTAAKPGSGAAPIAADQARLSDTQGADAALASAAAGPTGPAPLSSADMPALSDASAQTGQSSLSVSAATYTAPSGPASALPVPAPTGLTPAHAMVVAAPAQVVDIVSSAADDGQSDSIIVQLDPPELGRVSIDFKFDANGLQHVTITGETSEAMRQLRLMHFELIQALERHGIGSSNMTFQQQQQQHTQQSPLPNPLAGEPVKDRPGSAEPGNPVIPAYSLSSPRTPPGGRLDMKL